MSCLHQYNIPNNSLHYNILKPYRMIVPCNHCEACLNVRRHDWFIRSYYEFLQCQRYNGVSFMFTLTFNEFNVPRLFGRRVFDSTVMQKFIKRLRQYFYDRGINITFRYIAVPEYGETFGRPHYHIVFFVFPLHGQRFMNRDFYNAVKACWQQGFIHVKKATNYGQLLSVGALRYTVKYVTKNVHGYPLFWLRYRLIKGIYNSYLFSSQNPLTLRQIVDVLRETHVPLVDFAEYYEQYRSANVSITPKVHASLKFGMFALELLQPWQIEKEVVKAPVGEQYEFVAMPQYLKRKLFYNRIPNERDGKPTKLVLNDFGVEHFLSTLEARISQRQKSIRDTLINAVNDSIFDQIKDDLHRRFPLMFFSADDVNEYRSYCLDFIRSSAIYSVVYRGMIISSNYQGFDFFARDIYTSLYRSRLTAKESHHDCPIVDSSKSLRQHLESSYSASLELFELQENVLSFVEILSRHSATLKARQIYEQRELQFKQNDYKKSSDYETKQRNN